MAGLVMKRSAWARRRVLVTGHTGFKGSWLCLLLQHLGARVSGLALAPEPGPGLFRLLAPWEGLDHHEADLRDAAAVANTVAAIAPDVVFHLGAQALVRRGYREPVETFRTNVDGTIHLLQAMRGLRSVRAAVIVTSDKVYAQPVAGGRRAFREDDPLGGADPYSASKAACEVAVACWRHSWGNELPAVATARAGNVIGGGDFGEARLLPDLARAQAGGTSLLVRYPEATRPWQHVLDVLAGYLLLAERLLEDPRNCPLALNFGPSAQSATTVREVIAAYAAASGHQIDWHQAPGPQPPEAPHLALDASLAAQALNWQPRRTVAEAIAQTARWYSGWQHGEEVAALTRRAAQEELQ
jgi:CDP-glucose 4,6-dehydratase